MSEQSISISNLNDFIFCPASIYFHALDYDAEKMSYQCADQLNGTAAHKTVDQSSYSTDSSVLQGMSVYSEKYDITGKIDTFHTKEGHLRERKKKIKTIYDGYVFQLYAQCFALTEMGYSVKRLSLYSMDDNKSYSVALPENDPEMLAKFEAVVHDIKNFSFDGFSQSVAEKCKRCIYEPLCPYSAIKEET